MAQIAIVSQALIRVDDRLSTLGNTSYVEAAIATAPVTPVSPSFYGTLLIGITGVLQRPIPLILRVKKVYDFGVFIHIDELFPRGVPPDLLDLQWDCWYAPRRIGYELSVGGIQP